MTCVAVFVLLQAFSIYNNFQECLQNPSLISTQFGNSVAWVCHEANIFYLLSSFFKIIIFGFLIGWGIHSLFRRIKQW